MSVRGVKRPVVFAPEGYHPVKVARTLSKKLAGEHVALGNTGAGCAIDDIDPGDGEASLQTRGLVSIVVNDGDGGDTVRVGNYLYAVCPTGTDEISIQKGPDLNAPARGSAANVARPWGIVLQRGPRSRDGKCTARAFKFPGPFVIQSF